MSDKQDFICLDVLGNICATVTDSTLEHARYVFSFIDWRDLSVADHGTVNYQLIERREVNQPPVI